MNSSDIEQLVDIYGKDVYRFCYKLVKNKHDTDDLYQQTFLTALQLAEKIDAENNPKAFLFSISINIWKNDIRKSSRRERIAPTTPITEFNEEILGNDIDIASTVVNNELNIVMNEIIQSLDDKYRIPLLLYYNSEMNISNIAKICKCPSGTIKSRLNKARQLIKLRLEVLGYNGE